MRVVVFAVLFACIATSAQADLLDFLTDPFQGLFGDGTDNSPPPPLKNPISGDIGSGVPATTVTGPSPSPSPALANDNSDALFEIVLAPPPSPPRPAPIVVAVPSPPSPSPLPSSPPPSPILSPSPSPSPVTVISPTKTSPSPSPQPVASPAIVDDIKAKKSPPPPKNKSPPKSSGGGVSTTTIIIAVACGVGGLVAIVVIIAVWCSCRKGKKNAAAGKEHVEMDEEYGAVMHDQKMSAADVYKSELRPPPQQQYSQARMAPQAVPLQMLEPQDIRTGTNSQTILATQGPLGAGAAAGAVVATGISSAARPSPSKAPPSTTSSRPASSSRTASKRSDMPAGALPLAPAKEQYNDALLTWIGGQLSRDKEGTHQQSVPTNTPPSTTHRRMQSTRSRYDDVSAYEINFDAIRMGKPVGEGSFGKVYLASWNETPVAVKILVDSSTALDKNDPMKLRRITAPVLDKLGAEAGLMASMRHPNIIQFMGIVSLPPCVVTEYCEKGSLTDVLRRARKSEPGAAESLTWHRRIGMAIDAATGMLYLHARPQPIIHRDLKSPNLLVDSHWRVKVCDFNMSRILEESGAASSLSATNPRWLAPEVMGGESATIASDVFAFGVVLWEMLTWELPWLKDNPWSVVHMVSNGGRLTIPARWDLPGIDNQQFDRLDDFLALMQRCWAQNPYDRPGFGEIVQELKSLQSSVPNTQYTAVQSSSSPAPPASASKGTKTSSAVPSKSSSQAVYRPPTESQPSYYPEEEFDSGEYNDDYDYEDGLGDVTASMDSTAVVASVDHTASVAQWQTRLGWGSKQQQQQK